MAGSLKLPDTCSTANTDLLSIVALKFQMLAAAIMVAGEAPVGMSFGERGNKPHRNQHHGLGTEQMARAEANALGGACPHHDSSSRSL